MWQLFHVIPTQQKEDEPDFVHWSASFELGRARSHHYHCTLDKGRGSLEDMEILW